MQYNKTIESEKKIFSISLLGTLILTISGLLVFMISGSQIVLLDSLFSLITALDAIISYWVVSVSRKGSIDKYPYGLIQARPMLAMFKGLLIFGFIVSAIFNSVNEILSGGNIVAGRIIVMYSLISVVTCTLVITFFYIKADIKSSSLIKLETIQWIQAMLISLSIGIVFGISEFIKTPLVKDFSPYLDSGMVILISLLFIPSIIKEVKANGSQLLLESPTQEVKEFIRKYINSVCIRFNLEIRKIYLIHSSGLLYIDIELYVKEDKWNWNVVNLIRKETDSVIKKVHPNSEISISFYDYYNEDSPERILKQF
jgi:predicted Co/Zn/Cd cation transporter (cation efflux family)